MTIHPSPKPEPREKKAPKPLPRGKGFAPRKTPVAKVNKARLDKRTKAYRAYMASDAWKGRRLAALIAADYTCQRCGTPPELGCSMLAGILEAPALHVHHKSYASFKNERPEHLEVLCADCHNRHHANAAIQPRYQRVRKAG